MVAAAQVVSSPHPGSPTVLKAQLSRPRTTSHVLWGQLCPPSPSTCATALILHNSWGGSVQVDAMYVPYTSANLSVSTWTRPGVAQSNGRFHLSAAESSGASRAAASIRCLERGGSALCGAREKAFRAADHTTCTCATTAEACVADDSPMSHAKRRFMQQRPNAHVGSGWATPNPSPAGLEILHSRHQWLPADGLLPSTAVCGTPTPFSQPETQPASLIQPLVPLTARQPSMTVATLSNPLNVSIPSYPSLDPSLRQATLRSLQKELEKGQRNDLRVRKRRAIGLPPADAASTQPPACVSATKGSEPSRKRGLADTSLQLRAWARGSSGCIDAQSRQFCVKSLF